MDSKANKQKRSRNEYSDSETDNDIPQAQSFPRFLIIESTEEKPIASLSPFVIEKQIESLAGVPKSVKKLKSGSLLVEVDRPQYAKNLLKIEQFFHIKCKCYAHGSLNTSKGVIRCPDLAGVSETEIQRELKSQHVTNAKRICLKRDNKLQETNTIILTFGTSILPRTITVGYLVTKVDVYIPNPLQCYNCFKFGHGSRNCRAEEICPNCTANAHQHNEKDCKYPSKCINCGEEHSARSKTCKVWKVEKEVLQVKYSQNIAFPEARKIVTARHAAPATTYSSVIKSAGKTAQYVDAQTQTPKPKVDSTASEQTEQKTGNETIKTQQHKQTVPNVPNYQSTSKTHTSVSQSRRVNETPRQKIQLQTDRTKKGSDNPLSIHNRFESLSDQEEMEDGEDFVPDGPPSSVTKVGRIKRLSQPK